jgi:CRP/FNR family transcriptional regulator, dissimilatory nitrate respiration regulator
MSDPQDRIDAPIAPPPSIRALGLAQDLPAGSLLFSQGERADRFYHLESGEIRLFRTGRDDSEVELSRIRPGQWFGEVVLFAARAYPACARAESDSRVLRYLNRDLSPLLERDGQASAFFLRLLAEKCLSLSARLQELTVMPVRERFLRYLFRLCGSAGSACPGSGPCVFALPKRKLAIAAELGIVPETLSRSIKALEAEGLIAVSASKVTVKDCARLRSELADF